jgi:hypothetical protein
MNLHQFPIGTQYTTGGKHPRLCVITEHMTVTNSRGEIVQTYYQASHEFCGQRVTDNNVCAVTIARGLTSRSPCVKHQEITRKFLSGVDSKTRDDILTAVANHYGITQAEALEEITGDEAEQLLDYLTGVIRTATSVLMQGHGLALSIARSAL